MILIATISYGEADDVDWHIGVNKDRNVISYTSPYSPSAISHGYIITIYTLDAISASLPTANSLDVDYEALSSAIASLGTISTASLAFNDVTD